MADLKISALTEKTTPVADDLLVIVDSEAVPIATKKIKASNLIAKTLRDADGDTKIQTEESADEDIIRMDVAGVEAFLLSVAGVMTLAKQSCWRAHILRTEATNEQSIPSSTFTKIQFEDENYDQQNEYDPTTNYRFTATTAGKYLITCGVVLNNLPDGCRIILDLRKNGANLARFMDITMGAASAGGGGGAVQVGLAANDYLEAFVYQNSGAAKTIYYDFYSNHFAGTKVA